MMIKPVAAPLGGADYKWKTEKPKIGRRSPLLRDQTDSKPRYGLLESATNFGMHIGV